MEKWDTMHQNAILRERKISLKGKRRTNLTKCRKRENSKGKKFYAQEDSSGFESSNESSSEYGTIEHMLMALEELANDFQEYEEEEEGEVDFKEELISALDEIERLKLKNRKQK